MKLAFLSALVLFAALPCIAQTTQPVIEDFKPASTNQPGRQYPQVNSEGRVRARIVAPQAQSVELDISGVKYPMSKRADGAWVGDLKPFVIPRNDMFRTAGPPPLTSAKYARDLNEVKALGGVDSTVRTQDQTEAAKWWHDRWRSCAGPMAVRRPSRTRPN